MNSNQRGVLIIAAVVFLVMVLFPPMAHYHRSSRGESKTFKGYHIITTSQITEPLPEKVTLLEYLNRKQKEPAVYTVSIDIERWVRLNKR